ncbi:MAG: ATP-binding protein, partial [Clostridiales bacterium]|nr:ATP-binding protein [Clostridiales bacterium]
MTKGFLSNDEHLQALIGWGRQIVEEKAKAAERMKEIEDSAARSLESGLFLPLAYVCAAFSLRAFERHCLCLALLPELDSSFESAFAKLHGEEERRLLSLELAVRLFSADETPPLPYRDCLDEGSLLRRYFFDVTCDRGRSDLTAVLKLKRRIAAFITEGQIDNPALAGVCHVWEPDISAVAAWEPDASAVAAWESEEAVADRMERYFALTEARESGGIAFLLHGPKGVGKKRNILRFAGRMDQSVLFVDMTKLTPDLWRGHAVNGALLDDLYRESILRQSALCFDGLDFLASSDAVGRSAVGLLLEGALETANLVFATSESPLRLSGGEPERRCLSIPVAMPDEETRRLLWRRLSDGYAIAERVDLDELADKFILSPGQIEGALVEADKAAFQRGLTTIDRDCLYIGCYSRLDHTPDITKAMKLPASFAWEDLILPPASKDLLRLACEQVQYRHMVYHRWGFGSKLPYGRGLSLLFSGPPGTGKTMGAQVIANELRMELYKVDLAGVVSKYIGETEKNLREIFSEAKKSQAILFFDEADVLFSKRTEIREANDKYSNMEAAFLLQKIEEYEGVSVLATNYLQNIDEAFKRRIKFIVEFPFPNEAYRLLLWKAVFPAAVPLGEDLDRDYLAERFALSGSHIKNIAVNAAFMAAARSSAVT